MRRFSPSKIISALLSAAVIFQLSAAILPQYVSADTVELAITPKLSEGLYAENIDNLTVKGKESGDAFTFTEDKTLEFSVKVSDGWSFSERYSSIFEGDSAYVRVSTEKDTVAVTYKARKGRKVPASVLKNVKLNASADRLASLYIEIDGRASDIKKDAWTNATFELKQGSKKYESGDFGGSGRIKGRGNTSWTKADQKPYSISLDEKASICDIPKTKKYALITTSLDASLMRNYILYKSALGLDGIAYTVKCEMVNVYINNSNYGIYTLCERVSAEKNKINIEEATPENIHGGYVIEKNISDKIDFDNETWFKCPYQANQNLDFFTCKDPDGDEVTKEMTKYLEDLMQRVHDSIMGISNEDYKKYVDIPSWVDFAIMQEIAKNVDGNLKTSCFMVKPENTELISMTALWDFDYAFGNLNSNNASKEYNDFRDCPNADTAEGFMIINSSNPWFKKLYEKPEFKEKLCETYAVYRNTVIEDMIDLIYEGSAYIQTAVTKDTKWVKADEVSRSVENLRNWLINRVKWLDGEWLQSEEAGKVTVTEEKKLLSQAAETAKALKSKATGHALEDTFNNLIFNAETLLKDETADKNEIDGTAVELIRCYGILTWENLNGKTLSMYADAAAARGGGIGLGNAVSSAKKAIVKEDIQSAWYKITDALYGSQTDKDILDALIYQYEDISVNEYKTSVVRLVKRAVREGREVLDRRHATQAEIDSAVICIAGAFDGQSLDVLSESGFAAKYLPYIIGGSAAAVAVIAVITVAAVRKKKRTETNIESKDD